MTFALADTDSSLRTLLSNAMSHRFPASDILQFEDGKAALHSLKTQAIDALICALVLPELDGIGLLEELQPLRRRPRVMVLTRVTSDAILTRTLRLGADYYMIKPVDPGLVCRRLSDLLSEPSAAPIAPAVPATPTAPRDCAQLLSDMGLPSRFGGYRYMLCAVEMLRKEPELLSHLTTELYPRVGKHFGKSSDNVERSIRYAIDLIFSRNSALALSNCLNIDEYQLRRRPANRAFLSMLLGPEEG